MKITRLQLKNGYKRFFDLTIDLGNNPRKIVALVGPNGCGKSSVLDGMLFHNNAYNPLGNKGGKDHTYHSMLQTPNYSYQNIDIKFKEGDYQQVRSEKEKSGKENTIFSFRSPYRYNSNLRVIRSEATAAIRLNNYGATAVLDIDDKMEQNYRRLNIAYNAYMNKTDCPPSEAKRKIIGDLNSSLMKCLSLEISSIGNIEDNKGTLFFKKKDHPIDFEFNVLSSGEKEVVDILLDLYLRKDEYDDTIYLIDEPELHINTSIQRNLLLEIDNLVNDNCQIWIATHSIGFLRALQHDLKDKSQIIHFKDGVDWASTSQSLVPIKSTRLIWKEIFATALDDLTGLLSPKTIIYCEGKDTPGPAGVEKGLDASILNTIFNNNYYEVQFVSSGGNTELDQRSDIAILILSKVITDIEILVLKDRDMSSGRINNESDRQTYLNTNPKNHRVMYRWEIENYLYDKEVLKKFCIDIGKVFDESNYDGFVVDIINQNLKDHTGRIKNYCNLTTSINPEEFKKRLATYISDDMVVYKELEGCIFQRK